MLEWPAAKAALTRPTKSNRGDLKMAIRAASVAGVNAFLVDRARTQLQQMNNDAERSGTTSKKLRRMLDSGRGDAKSLKIMIELAESVGVTDEEDGGLLAPRIDNWATPNALARAVSALGFFRLLAARKLQARKTHVRTPRTTLGKNRSDSGQTPSSPPLIHSYSYEL